MFDNIPKEMRKLPQWVCFDINADGQKIPYIPGTDSQASSNRPTEWRSFRAACEDVKTGKRPHIGFCFASHNNLTFVDLDDISDDEQADVLEKLDSYAQRSVSGKGVHVICCGTFRGPGKHPKSPHAGIFKEGRFCLMTGDVLPGRTEIKEVSEDILQTVHSWLGGGINGSTTIDLVEYKPTIPDLTVYQMCRDKSPKFEDLCAGKWEHYDEYNYDHSSADHALIALLCDHTECNEQVRWMFKVSGMWTAERREKKAGHGENGYIDFTIKKIRANQQKDYERSRLVQLDFKRPMIEIVETPSSMNDRGSDHMIEGLPDGIIKEIARHSYRTAYLPLQEASLLTGISVVAGIAGRGYLTPTGMGLNLWTILVGTTGCGKDEYQGGMQRVFTNLSKKLPAIANIFGGEIASGPGLETVFSDTKRFTSYVPEFASFYKNTANPNGQPHQASLQKALLNSFNTAKLGGAIRIRRKAQNEETARLVERPCLSLVGEATPDALYASMSTGDIATGLLPRFILIEVSPRSLSLRPNDQSNPPLLPQDIMDTLERLAFQMDKLDAQDGYMLVKQAKTAGKLLSDYDYEQRKLIYSLPEGDPTRELRNRSALKVYRLATLMAVSEDIDTPRIATRHFEWAHAFVEQMDAAIIERFTKGKVGSGQVQQEAELLSAFQYFVDMTYTQRLSIGLTPKCAEDRGTTTLEMLKNATVNRPSFAADKNGAVTAFHRCLDNLTKVGRVIRYGKEYSCDNFGVRLGEVVGLAL